MQQLLLSTLTTETYVLVIVPPSKLLKGEEEKWPVNHTSYFDVDYLDPYFV